MVTTPQEATENSPAPVETSPNAKWTLLVYLAGDNNLTSEMVWGLQELKKTSFRLKLDKKGVHVVAHFDPGTLRSRRYDFVSTNSETSAPSDIAPDRDGNLDATFVYTKRFVDSMIQQHKNLSRLGQPGRLLSAFVLSQIDRFDEADHLMLVLSGHGSGAEGDFLMDTDPRTSLSIPELRMILSEACGLYRAKNGQGRDRKDARIAVLGMDSCLMSNVEVCYEVRGAVDYLVASEGFVENTGWPYHRVLEALLVKDPGEAVPRTVSKQIVRLYTDFYRDYEVAGVSTDIAVCDLDVFRRSGGLVQRLGEFAQFLVPELEGYHARKLVERATKEAIESAKTELEQLAQEIATLLKIEPETLVQRDSESKESSSSAPADEVSGVSAEKKDAERAAKAQLLELMASLKVDHEHEDSEHCRHGSAKAALLELMQSLDQNYRQGSEQQEPTLKDLLADLPGKLKDEVSDPSAALAMVRARRELDPGVRKALKAIEELDTHGKPEAKKARAMLLKFHQLRSMIELAEFDACKKSGTDASRRLPDALADARREAQSFKGGAYVDLYDFCDRIQEKLSEDKYFDKLRDTLTELKRQIGSNKSYPNDAVVLSLTTGADFQHAHGLSVYFPVTAADYTPKYMNLQFAKETGWGRLVRAYLEATRRPRRDEATLWFSPGPIRRYGAGETDPLRRGDIESRIIGVDEAEVAGGAAIPTTGKGGGTDSAKGGGTDSAKGKRLNAVFGNPPDGFYRR